MKENNTTRRLGRHIGAFAIAVILSVFLPGIVSGDDRAVKLESAKDDFKKGLILFNGMRYIAAAEHFRKALSYYEDYFTAREYLARSYRLAGYFDEARTEWEFLYKDTDSPLVKSKIDSINFRSIGAQNSLTSELIPSLEINSNDQGRYAFPNPTDLAVDSERRIYVTSFSGGKLVRFDSNGNGEDIKLFSYNSKIYGIDIRNDLIAVTDFARDEVHLLDTNLKIKKTFGGTGEADGKFHGPEGVSFDNSGNIYIADSGNARVQKFSHDGNFILSMGTAGSYEAELKSPSDMVIVDRKVFITDTGNKRIAVFDDSGNFERNISIEGLSGPKGITLAGNELVISDDRAGVRYYDLATEETREFKEWDDGDESFSRVAAATIDRDGFFYCLDSSRQKVNIFSTLGAKYTNLDVEVQSVDITKYPIVALYLAVRNRAGEPVYGLTTQNLLITEDSAIIRNPYLEYLKDKAKAVSVVFAVDRSAEAKKYMSDLSWAAEFFLRKMHKADAVRVVSFNDDVWADDSFDWSRRRALKILGEGKYSGGKSIGRALYQSIADAAPRITNRAVVLFTDGVVTEDSFNRVSSNRVIAYANEHFVPVYIVSFGQPDIELQRIARDTGGECIRASDASKVNTIYDKIRSREEYRYVVCV